MSFYITVAWRNIWRNTRRSLITGLAMSISVALCMAMIGINDGFYQAFFDVMVTHRLGHVQIRHTDYAKTKSYDTIDSANALYDEIASTQGVQQMTGRLYGNALVGGDIVSSGSMITGVFPKVKSSLAASVNKLSTDLLD